MRGERLDGTPAAHYDAEAAKGAVDVANQIAAAEGLEVVDSDGSGVEVANGRMAAWVLLGVRLLPTARLASRRLRRRSARSLTSWMRSTFQVEKVGGEAANAAV